MIVPINREHVDELADGENVTIKYNGREVILVPPPDSENKE